MTGTLGSDNHFPKITVAEGSAPSTPASGLGYIYEKTDNKLYFKNDAGTETELTNVAGTTPLHVAYICVAEEQTSGTNGGTFTSGAWRTRVINTERTDTGGDCSLASNQITLAAGTYDCKIYAPAEYCDGHQARLQNTTAATTLLIGQNAYSSNNESDVTATPAIVAGSFTVAASQALEVQHRCAATRATDGFGFANGWGTEVYTFAEFWKRG